MALVEIYFTVFDCHFLNVTHSWHDSVWWYSLGSPGNEILVYWYPESLFRGAISSYIKHRSMSKNDWLLPTSVFGIYIKLGCLRDPLEWLRSFWFASFISFHVTNSWLVINHFICAITSIVQNWHNWLGYCGKNQPREESVIIKGFIAYRLTHDRKYCV